MPSLPRRCHECPERPRGIAELPNGWMLEVGDLLVDEDDRLVRVLELIPGKPIVALVRVAPAVSHA
jgi:hypothetical protein